MPNIKFKKRFIPQNKITATLEKNAQREKLNSTKNSGGNLGNIERTTRVNNGDDGESNGDHDGKDLTKNEKKAVS